MWQPGAADASVRARPGALQGCHAGVAQSLHAKTQRRRCDYRKAALLRDSGKFAQSKETQQRAHFAQIDDRQGL